MSSVPTNGGREIRASSFLAWLAGPSPGARPGSPFTPQIPHGGSAGARVHPRAATSSRRIIARVLLPGKNTYIRA